MYITILICKRCKRSQSFFINGKGGYCAYLANVGFYQYLNNSFFAPFELHRIKFNFLIQFDVDQQWLHTNIPFAIFSRWYCILTLNKYSYVFTYHLFYQNYYNHLDKFEWWICKWKYYKTLLYDVLINLIFQNFHLLILYLARRCATAN